MSDPANGGYVHAPSLPHATTAAILRSGYLANATAANPQSLAVNLSSDRVRTALAMLEGIRNGQSLGALLGYQFERALHDDYGLAEVGRVHLPPAQGIPAGRRRPGADRDAAGRADRGDRGPQRAGRPQAGRPDHLLRQRPPTRSASPRYPPPRPRRPPRSVRSQRPARHLRRARATWRWPRECTKRRRETSSASPAPSTLTRPGNFPPEPARSSRRRRPASG